MKKLLIISILAIFNLAQAEEAKVELEKTAKPLEEQSLDVSVPEERGYIETKDGSVRLYEDKIELWNSACEFFELAMESFDKKDYDSALFMCDQAITHAPEEIYEKWAMYMLKGDILRFMSKYEEARESYFKISKDREYIGIRHAQALYKIGLSFYEEEKWGKAHPYFERVYVAYYKFEYYASRAYFYDAKNFVHLKERETAIRILREYIRIAKVKDSDIYKQAQALNRELLGIL